MSVYSTSSAASDSANPKEIYIRMDIDKKIDQIVKPTFLSLSVDISKLTASIYQPHQLIASYVQRAPQS